MICAGLAAIEFGAVKGVVAEEATRRYTRLKACIITLPSPPEPATPPRNDPPPAPKAREPVNYPSEAAGDNRIRPTVDRVTPEREPDIDPPLANRTRTAWQADPIAESNRSRDMRSGWSDTDAEVPAPVLSDDTDTAAAPPPEATGENSNARPVFEVRPYSEMERQLAARQPAVVAENFPHGDWWLVSIGVQAVGAVAGVLNWLLLATLLFLLVHPRFAGRLIPAMLPAGFQQWSPAGHSVAAGISPADFDRPALAPSAKPALDTKIIELHTLLDEAAGTWSAEREGAGLARQQAETAILGSIFDENLEILGKLSRRTKAA